MVNFGEIFVRLGSIYGTNLVISDRVCIRVLLVALGQIYSFLAGCLAPWQKMLNWDQRSLLIYSWRANVATRVFVQLRPAWILTFLGYLSTIDWCHHPLDINFKKQKKIHQSTLQKAPNVRCSRRACNWILSAARVRRRCEVSFIHPPKVSNANK